MNTIKIAKNNGNSTLIQLAMRSTMCDVVKIMVAKKTDTVFSMTQRIQNIYVFLLIFTSSHSMHVR